MLELNTVQQISIWILPVLFAITLHEAGHAWAAYRLGDPTAALSGRLSLNPLKHIDLIGTILVPIMILLLSNFSFIFGWAKPVMIDARYFKNPKRDVALATLAGPMANLLMAIFWCGCLKIGIFFNPMHSQVALFMLLTGKAGILINLFFAFLNLLPIPPLDGSRILSSFLSFKVAKIYHKIEPYGFFILIFLMISGVLNLIINPLIDVSIAILQIVFRL